jgi:hypothetical protein
MFNRRPRSGSRVYLSAHHFLSTRLQNSLLLSTVMLNRRLLLVRFQAHIFPRELVPPRMTRRCVPVWASVGHYESTRCGQCKRWTMVFVSDKLEDGLLLFNVDPNVIF